VTIYPDLAEEDALTAWPDGDEPDQNSLVTPRPYDVCSLTMELFQAGGEPGNTRGCWVIKMVMVHGRLKLELQEDTKVVPIVKWCVSTSNKGSELFVTLRNERFPRLFFCFILQAIHLWYLKSIPVSWHFTSHTLIHTFPL
jgi:hypothetical protein